MNRVTLAVVVVEISFVHIRKRVGARTEPWGTHAATERGEESLSSILTEKVRFLRKDSINLIKLIGMSI